MRVWEMPGNARQAGFGAAGVPAALPERRGGAPKTTIWNGIPVVAEACPGNSISVGTGIPFLKGNVTTRPLPEHSAGASSYELPYVLTMHHDAVMMHRIFGI